MILYDYVLSASCYKIRLMAALSGQQLELQAVNFHPAREHKSLEMLKLNPGGTLPILRDEDLIMTDSSDMLRHLTRNLPEWRGDDDGWLNFARTLNETLGMARLHDVLGFEVDIDAARKRGVHLLRLLEAHLTEQRFDGMIFLTGVTPTRDRLRTPSRS